MSLQRTNLLIQMGPIPATFDGTPQELSDEMVRRMQIVSPAGTNFIYIGDTEPTSNVGPWLRNGTQWWVYDDSIKRYVPQDISQSETEWFWAGASTPASTPPLIWLRTTSDYTQASPSYGNPIGWYVFNGAAWLPFAGITLSGPTASRPPAPLAYQQYYDTDISVLIWYERSAWRTVDGLPGDVKATVWDTLTDALLHNPGWEVLGQNQTAWRGRYISQATKDPGATPQTDLTVAAGIAERASHETYGETDGISMDTHVHPASGLLPLTGPAEVSAVPFPCTICLWHLVKT